MLHIETVDRGTLKIVCHRADVLASTMFNIYTTDQPISKNQSINHYTYVDNCAITMQDASFEIVEKKHMTTGWYLLP